MPKEPEAHSTLWHYGNNPNLANTAWVDKSTIRNQKYYRKQRNYIYKLPFVFRKYNIYWKDTPCIIYMIWDHFFIGMISVLTLTSHSNLKPLYPILGKDIFGHFHILYVSDNGKNTSELVAIWFLFYSCILSNFQFKNQKYMTQGYQFNVIKLFDKLVLSYAVSSSEI